LLSDQYRQGGAKRVWRAAKGFWCAGEQTKAIAAAQKAADVAPEHIRYHLSLAEFRSKSGDKLGAVAGLKSAAEKVTEPDLRSADAQNAVVKLADALQRGGELETAWNVLGTVAPDHRRAQRLRYVNKYLQGDLEGARTEASAYLKLHDSPVLRLSVTDLLDECLTQAEADDQEPEVAKWLWPRFNLPESRRQDWLLRLRWGLLVNDLISAWILSNRERLHELDDLVEPPDWSLLAAAREEGKPVVLTGLHLGPQLVAVHYVDRLHHPMLIVAASLNYAVAVGSKTFLSATEAHSIIELRDALARFGTVFLAGDGRRGRSRYPAKFFGSTVFLREGPSALARLGQAQSFLVAARWVGHRIKLDLVQGPAPLKDESREAWNERWFSFYMTQFERLVLAGPENIRTKCLWFLDQQ
jgi:hypothetical protein